MSIRNTVGCATIALLCVAGAASAAGKSDVADAASKGDKAAVRTLIQQKADVNAPQVDGATALHWAVYHEDADLVDLLIRAGGERQSHEPRGRHAPDDGGALRQRRHHRSPPQSGRRREGAWPERRDDADVRGAERQPGSRAALHRSWRRRQRQGKPPADDGAHVGGRTEAPGSGEGAARQRRRPQAEVRDRRHATQLHGEPRQYHHGPGSGGPLSARRRRRAHLRGTARHRAARGSRSRRAARARAADRTRRPSARGCGRGS